MMSLLNRVTHAAVIAVASLAMSACDSPSSEPDSGPFFEVIDFASGASGTVWGTSNLSLEEFEALDLPSGWIKNQPREVTMDASTFLRSPGRSADGESTQQEMFGQRWLHVASIVSVDGPLDDDGLLNALVSRDVGRTTEPQITSPICLISPV